MTETFEEVWKHVENYVVGRAHNQCSRDPDEPVSRTMMSLWKAYDKGTLKDMEHAKAYAMRSVNCNIATWWSNNTRQMKLIEDYTQEAPTSCESNASAAIDLAEILEDLNVIKMKVMEVARGISPRHERVVACKYEGMSLRETAELCNIGKMTASRNLKEVMDKVTEL